MRAGSPATCAYSLATPTGGFVPILNDESNIKISVPESHPLCQERELTHQKCPRKRFVASPGDARERGRLLLAREGEEKAGGAHDATAQGGHQGDGDEVPQGGEEGGRTPRRRSPSPGRCAAPPAEPTPHRRLGAESALRGLDQQVRLRLQGASEHTCYTIRAWKMSRM